MRSRNHFQGALPRRSLRPVVAEAKADGVSGSPHLVTLPTTAQPSVHLARPNPPRINTSVNPSFFIKSLIMNDLKSIRISIADNKSSRINTSSTCSRKPSIINTSKKHPGGGGVKPGGVQTGRIPHRRSPTASEGARDDADSNDAKREIGAPRESMPPERRRYKTTPPMPP